MIIAGFFRIKKILNKKTNLAKKDSISQSILTNLTEQPDSGILSTYTPAAN
jgi:hypothetical protein